MALHFLQNSTPFWCKNHFCISKTVEIMSLWNSKLLHCAMTLVISRTPGPSECWGWAGGTSSPSLWTSSTLSSSSWGRSSIRCRQKFLQYLYIYLQYLYIYIYNIYEYIYNIYARYLTCTWSTTARCPGSRGGGRGSWAEVTLSSDPSSTQEHGHTFI